VDMVADQILDEARGVAREFSDAFQGVARGVEERGPLILAVFA
jgi:hypothetical protein